MGEHDSKQQEMTDNCIMKDNTYCIMKDNTYCIMKDNVQPNRCLAIEQTLTIGEV